jgi:hypothetical protein
LHFRPALPGPIAAPHWQHSVTLWRFTGRLDRNPHRAAVICADRAGSTDLLDASGIKITSSLGIIDFQLPITCTLPRD